MKQRNIVTCIILSIVTCGIYGIYWFIQLTNDTNTLNEAEGTSGGMAFLLTLITCNIYGLFWAYKQGEKITAIKAKKGQQASNLSVIYLVLSIFGLGIVAWAMMQNELNQYIPA
jgi:hypothetical protein